MRKEKIVDILIGFVILYTMNMGFWATYLFVWLKVGLRLEWWGFLITLALALLSLFGLYRYVKKEADNP